MAQVRNSLKVTILLSAAIIIGLPVFLFTYSGCNSAAEGEANGASDEPAISADGRFIAFSSEADNLVQGDNNGSVDIFVKNAETGQTLRVSTNGNGDESNADSSEPSISADGNYIAFTSEASNLIPDDNNTCSNADSSWNCSDVYVKNINTGAIERVSTSSDGTQGDWFSNSPSISADGRYVAFTSYASNLVPDDTDACDDGNAPRNCADVFVKDRQSNQTSRISYTPEGVEGDGDSTDPDISGDGRYVVFTSEAASLAVDDENGVSDVFFANLETGDISRVSETIDNVGGNGPSFQPAISEDGRYIAFASEASNFTDGVPGTCLEAGSEKTCTNIYLQDFITGVFTRISKSKDGTEINGSSTEPSISADGRMVVYSSTASNLVEGDAVACDEESMSGNCSDIFLSKLLLGTTTLVSASSDGNQGDWYSYAPAMSGDGNFVAFVSYAANLVSGDTNACSDGETKWNCADVFRRNLMDKTVIRVSTVDGTT